MIQFKNWTISALCGEVIARQYDNLSRTLTVMGDLPAGWDWSMLVESGGNLNIISLSPVDGGVGVTLTADMIPYAGYYRMQLRGTQGEAVRHTNIIQVYIPESLTGEGQWPDLPSEFGQIEERMQELAGQAQDSADAADTSAKAAAESAAAAQGAEESVAANAKAAQTAARNAQKSAETAQEARQGAQAAQQAIEDMTATAETLAPGSDATVTKTVSPEGVVNLEFGIPEGKPGTGDMMSDGSVPMTGALNMGGNRVTNVGAPTEPTDAVRQQDLEAVSQEVDHILDGTTPAYIPPATDTKLGGIIIGPGLSVAEDGTASALEINDAIITDANPWSSRKIVDTLAPEFETSGAVVTCTPVAGYPLHVVSQIMPVQEGEGDPSPDNVRPISGWTEATLTHNDTPITLPFGQTVYGGTLDWTTGVLIIHSKYLELNSAYDYFVYDSPPYPKGVSCNKLDARYNLAEAICSHGECMQNFVSDKPSYFWIGVNNPDVYWVGIMDELGFNSLEEFKSWLDTQDVQIVYKTQNPITIQLTPQEILALSGTNNIYADTGDTTVSGRADPNAVINNLAQRIAALEEQAING